MRLCVLWITMFIVGVRHAPAQTWDREMSGLANSLSKALLAKGCKTVAAVDFTDLQGQPNELGRFLSEQIGVEIVATGVVSMVDRANIKSILAEHKLTEEGLVNPANAKKLGEFAGVDAILIGNVTALDQAVVLTVKAISTSSATIVAAGRITFPKTSEIQQLLNRTVSGIPATGSTVREPAGPSYKEAEAIATKDIGPLRIVLRSVMPVRNGAAVRCSLEFISRETQRPVTVAMNTNQPGAHNRGDCRMGEGLRSSLADSYGNVYKLPNSNVSGIGVIGVGCDDMASYNPTQIGSLLANQDRYAARGQQLREYIYGATSIIEPGKSAGVTLEFVLDRNSTPRGRLQDEHPQVFHLNTEIVVGLAGANGRNAYSLQNVTFDRVTMPRF